jgi:hypothetical protein
MGYRIEGRIFPNPILSNNYNDLIKGNGGGEGIRTPERNFFL